MRHAVGWLGRHDEKSLVSLTDDESLMANHMFASFFHVCWLLCASAFSTWLSWAVLGAKGENCRVLGAGHSCSLITGMCTLAKSNLVRGTLGEDPS